MRMKFENTIKISLLPLVGTSHKAPVKSRTGYLATKQRRNSGLVTWQRLPSHPTVGSTSIESVWSLHKKATRPEDIHSSFILQSTSLRQ
jgi:hypothetical protein